MIVVIASTHHFAGVETEDEVLTYEFDREALERLVELMREKRLVNFLKEEKAIERYTLDEALDILTVEVKEKV